MLTRLSALLKQPESRKQYLFWALGLALIYFVFLHRIGHPNLTFWDEKHHLTSANRYLEGIMFMEAHPPLGKLLMALSEKIMGTNAHLAGWASLTEGPAKQIPVGYDHFPSRIPSSVLAAIGAVLLFLILREMTGFASVGVVIASMYVFDTATVLQSRSAMLDGIVVSFSLMTILCFVRLMKRTQSLRVRDYALMALFAALAASTKVNSLVLLLLFPILWGHENRAKLAAIIRAPKSEPVTPLLAPLGVRAGVSLAVFLGIFCGIMYIHTGLGSKVVPKTYYRASLEYKAIIDEGKNTWALDNAWLMIRDQVVHLYKYNKGVPPLKLYNPAENGSYPLKWPFGGKAIRYRWDRKGDIASFMYLVPNAFSWGVGLIGLFMSSVLVIGNAIGEMQSRNNRLLFFMRTFLLIWVTYMFILIHSPRVMYLYHYLIPLNLSWMLAGLSFAYIFGEELKQKSRWLASAMTLMVLQAVSVFLYFMPFCYHLPLTSEQFNQRAWSSIWEMRFEP